MATIYNTEINQTKYEALVQALVNNSVSGDRSAFSEMADKLEEYLDKYEDMDDAQKAGIYADSLRGTFKDINVKAMDIAYKMLEHNANSPIVNDAASADLDIKQDEAKLKAKELELAKKSLELKNREIDAANSKVLLDKYTEVEQVAKLNKQYGVKTDKFKIDSTGAIVADGEYLLTNTAEKGALDFQIQGYTDINKKDALKTVMEGLSMLANAEAQVIPSWMGEYIVAAVADMSGKSIVKHKVNDEGTAETDETYTVAPGDMLIGDN